MGFSENTEAIIRGMAEIRLEKKIMYATGFNNFSVMKISLGTHIINVDSLCPPLAVMKAKHIDT